MLEAFGPVSSIGPVWIPVAGSRELRSKGKQSLSTHGRKPSTWSFWRPCPWKSRCKIWWEQKLRQIVYSNKWEPSMAIYFNLTRSRKSATITSCLTQAKVQEKTEEIFITKGRGSPGSTGTSWHSLWEVEGGCIWCSEFSEVDWDFL